MQRFFARLDSNGDGAIDQDKLKAMANPARSRQSTEPYGGPIVYGVAVGDGGLFIRTGTRMYCVRNSTETKVTQRSSND